MTWNPSVHFFRFIPGFYVVTFFPLGWVFVGLGFGHPLTQSLHQKMEKIKGDDKVYRVPKSGPY